MPGPMITLIMAKKKAAGPGGYFDSDEEPEEMEAEDSEETEEEDEEEGEEEPSKESSPEELRAMAQKLMAHADKMEQGAKGMKPKAPRFGKPF
jgi:hypothetical protein